MDERTVSISLPPDLYAELEHTPMFRGRLKNKVQLSLAVGMFVSKEISLSRAAEYAGMALQDFIELLNNFGVPVVNYTEEMLEDDMIFAKVIQI